MPITFLDDEKELDSAPPSTGRNKVTFLDEEEGSTLGSKLTAGGAGFAEGYAGLKGFKVGMDVGTKLAPKLVNIPYAGPALAMAAPIVSGMVGMGLANRGAQAVEAGVGIKPAIDKAKAENPTLTTVASLAPMGSQAVQSVRALAQTASKSVPQALAKVGIGAGAGAAMTYPQHLIDVGIHKLTGSTEELPTPAIGDYAFNAGLGGVLGGAHPENARPKPKSELLEPTIKPPVVEEDVPLDTPATPEEQQVVNDAIAGKVRAVEATDKAADIAEATGTLPQTADALRKQSQRVAKKPVTPPTAKVGAEPAVAPVVTPEVQPAPPAQPAGPEVTNAAQALATKLGIDVSQLSANQNNKITTREVNAWKNKQLAPKSSVENESIPGWKFTDLEGVTDEEFLTKVKGAIKKPKKPVVAEPPRQSADPELDAALASSNTVEEFVAWAKANKRDVIRPLNGGFFPPSTYFGQYKQKAPAAPATAAPPVAPEAPPEAPVVAGKVPRKVAAASPEAPLVVAPEPPAAKNDNLEQRNWMLARSKEIAREKDQPYTNFGEWAEANPDDFNQMAVEWRAIQEGTNVEPPAPAAPPVAPEAPPVAPEAPLVAPEAPLVAPEAPPIAPEAPPEAPQQEVLSNPNAGLQDNIISQQPFGDYSGLNIVRPALGRGRDGLNASLSPSGLKRFATEAEAEGQFQDLDHANLTDFFNRAHSELAVSVNDSTKARTSIRHRDAIIGSDEGFSASSLSQYQGAAGMNWMKTVEALKSAKSGAPSVLFSQKSGGLASLFEIDTPTADFKYASLRLREAGIKNATLVRDVNGNVKAYILVQDPANYANNLAAAKKFAHDVHPQDAQYEIRVYKGDTETIGRTPDENANILRESLGQYTSPDNAQWATRSDRDRVANSLWELSREAGIDLGPRPTVYEDPTQRATAVSKYGVPLEVLQEAESKIPKRLLPRYEERLTRAGDFLAKLLGMSRFRLHELGTEKSFRNERSSELFKQYEQDLRNRIEGKKLDPNSLVLDLVERLDNQDRTKDLGPVVDESQAMAQYRGYYRHLDNLRTIAYDQVRLLLAKYAVEKPPVKSVVKGVLKQLEEMDQKIALKEEELSSQPRKKKADKEALNKLREERDDLSRELNPWTLDNKGLNKWVEDRLKNAVNQVRGVEEKRAQAGMKEQSFGDVDEATAMDKPAVAESSGVENEVVVPGLRGENGVAEEVITPEHKAAALEMLRSPDTIATDQVAIAEKLLVPGVLTKGELKVFAPEFKALDTHLKRQDQQSPDRARRSLLARERGREIAQNRTLSEILEKKHRDEKGKYLYSPNTEGADAFHDAPPQILQTSTAREYLQNLLDLKSISSEDSALVSKLLQQANLDNIPVHIYDYLVRSHGQYNRRTGEVSLNHETLTPERQVKTGLHEVNHALLGYFLNPRNAESLNSRQKKLVGDLNRLYQQTTEAAIKGDRFTRERLQEVQGMSENGALRLPDEKSHAAYQYSNVYEWAAAMMSDAEFREQIKGVKTRDVVTGKMRVAWEVFKDLVAKLFGVDRSIHKKAFDGIMELALDPDAGMPSGERGQRADFSPEGVDLSPTTGPSGREYLPANLRIKEGRDPRTGEIDSYRVFRINLDGSLGDILQSYDVRKNQTPERAKERAEEYASKSLKTVARRSSRYHRKYFGQDLSWRRDVDYSPMVGEPPRFTEKVSTAKANDELSPEDKVSFRAQTLRQAAPTAEQYKANGGTLEGLLQFAIGEEGPLTGPETLRALGLFGSEARATRVGLEKKANPAPRDIRARQEAADAERKATRKWGEMMSAAGQTLGHGQHVDMNSKSGHFSIDDAILQFLGKTPAQMASGKIDLTRMMDGIREIKQKAAENTMLALGPEFEKAGVTDLVEMQRLLSHPDTTFKDILNTLAGLSKGSDKAGVREFAERIHRIYSISANTIAKRDMPKVVQETYNGESIVPRGDQFLKKLNEFLKLGKYNEDDINATLLESLGNSGYDLEFIKGIRRDIDKVSAMPEGDMRNTASVEVWQKVQKKLMNNVFKDLRAPGGMRRVRDLVIAAWQSGVLSGPPTATVNAVASHASIWTESLVTGFGYALKTKDPRYVADVFSGFFSALLGDKSTGRASSAKSEAYASLLGRGTKYRNALREDMPILENIDTTDASAPIKLLGGYADKLKYIGRTLSAFDAVNMTMADEAQQRMAARFFLSQTKGHRASEVSDIMQKLFNPDEVTVTKARELAEQEVKANLGDRSAKEQERWVTRRTSELLQKQREEIIPEISEQGRSSAERYTYNETARGLIGRFAVGLSAEINQKIPEAKFVLSFMNTLVNIMNQTLDYTPYGYLRAKNWSAGQRNIAATDKYAQRTYVEGSPEQAAQIARATLGTMTVMSIAYMAYQGYEEEKNGAVPYFTVTGSGPRSPSDRQDLIDTRAWQPNSVKIGETWYRYMDFPILSSALGGIGTMMDAFRYKKDEDTTESLLMNSTFSAMSTVLDKQLLQGANNFFQVLRGSQPGQQTSAAKKLAGGVVGGFTNPGMAKWLRSTVDMDANGMVNQLDNSTTAGWFASMIPFSIGYNTAALNTLGEPIQRPWYSATTRRFAEFNTLKPHPIITPLIEAGLSLPDPRKATQFTYTDPKTGTKVTTGLGKHPEVMRRYVELRGIELKRMLNPAQIAALQNAARVNKDNAQNYLTSKIGDTARKIAIAKVEREIRAGTVRL